MSELNYLAAGLLATVWLAGAFAVVRFFLKDFFGKNRGSDE